MCRFEYADQLVGCYHGDVFTPTSLDDDHLSVFGYLID
jgi:hypothetical protein